ncbi:hypothetical protein RU639_005095 [Aspergillus parasiticus]
MEQYKERMKPVSMHYYQIKANKTSDLQGRFYISLRFIKLMTEIPDLMNHDEVNKGTAIIKRALQNLTTIGADVPIVLGEVGNTLGHGSSGVNLEGVLGSALWQVDFSLYTIFLGVHGITFYAQTFAAEFIGSNGNVTVANIDLGQPHLSAYAAYEGANLARLAIINFELWDGRHESQEKRHSKQMLLHQIYVTKYQSSAQGWSTLPVQCIAGPVNEDRGLGA